MDAASKRADKARAREAEADADDTLRRCLTDEERAKLSIDSWEPSLLRNLLDAQGKLDCGKS